MVEEGTSMQRFSPEMHSAHDSSRFVQLSKWRHRDAPMMKVNHRQSSIELQLWRQFDAEVEDSVPSRTPLHSPSTKQIGSGIVQFFSPENQHIFHVKNEYLHEILYHKPHTAPHNILKIVRWTKKVNAI